MPWHMLDTCLYACPYACLYTQVLKLALAAPIELPALLAKLSMFGLPLPIAEQLAARALALPASELADGLSGAKKTLPGFALRLRALAHGGGTACSELLQRLAPPPGMATVGGPAIAAEDEDAQMTTLIASDAVGGASTDAARATLVQLLGDAEVWTCCADMYVDMDIESCVDMYVWACLWTCVLSDTCIDVRVEMRMHMCVRTYRHVY